MRKAKWLYFWGLLLLIVQSCAMPLEPRFEQISSFQPHGAREGSPAGITLGLDLHNPNPYKIKLLAYDLDVYVNGKKVGDATRKGKQVMSAKGTSTIMVELATDLRQMLGGLLGALEGLLGNNSVQIKVDGSIVARAKGIQKAVPVTFEKAWALGK